MIIAIDGPAASGKGTLAKELARYYRLPHLDTGLLYRAVAKAIVDAGARFDEVDAAVRAAREIDPPSFNEKELKRASLADAASLVSAIPEVRLALVSLQRQFGQKGAVLDGRDVGTVIFPDAEVKIFVTAAPEVRARRRAAELSEAGEPTPFSDVLADILRRDERDTTRAAAPLKPAPDAYLLDSTHLDIDATFRAAVAIVEAVRAGRKRG